MRKLLLIALVIVLSLVMVTGCGTSNSTTDSTTDSATENETTGGEILIGGNLELTGGAAPFGNATKNSVELAFEQVNANGGILGGKTLKFIVADNKTDAGESTASAVKLITQDKVQAIIGCQTSGDSIAASPVCEQNKIPMISPASTNIKVTVENGTLKAYIFRACFIDDFAGTVAANFLSKDKNAKTATMIIDQKSDYSKGMAEAFEKTFTANGGSIVSTEKYTAGADTDFRAILTRISSAKPDCIFIPGFYQEVGLIIKQARGLGMQQPIMGGDGWSSPQLVELAGGPENLKDCFIVDHVSLTDPAVADFVSQYKAKYNIDPNAEAILAYDTANLLINAFENAGSADPEKVREALENTKDFKGLAGVINMDPATHNPQKSAVITEYIDGKPTFLQKIDPQ
ncbi:ABC transporter substrate-binding protein [Candidatus Formimonas warabiya]|uniref:Ethanolamine utilization protein EutJ n=1 Tax=Formimonas warabiya TaxID=1761012 RepID=A0A3G1KUQ3_FORW1|nr:ABC transporter substrate-binding protein [Candidatus Formimonas warabiya]ATW26171.1 ethanolamine utilization protein EutJ [Candidatus Formimonas warabiya]